MQHHVIIIHMVVAVTRWHMAFQITSLCEWLCTSITFIWYITCVRQKHFYNTHVHNMSIWIMNYDTEIECWTIEFSKSITYKHLPNTKTKFCFKNHLLFLQFIKFKKWGKSEFSFSYKKYPQNSVFLYYVGFDVMFGLGAWHANSCSIRIM